MVDFQILKDNQGRLFLHIDATDSTYICEITDDLTDLEQTLRQPATPLDRDSDTDNGDSQ